MSVAHSPQKPAKNPPVASNAEEEAKKKKAEEEAAKAEAEAAKAAEAVKAAEAEKVAEAEARKADEEKNKGAEYVNIDDHNQEKKNDKAEEDPAQSLDLIKQMMAELKKQEEEILKKQKEKSKEASSTNTDKAVRNIREEIAYRLKHMKQENIDPPPDAPPDKDNGSVASFGSHSLFGTNDVGRIKRRLSKALSSGERALKSPRDKEVLKTAKSVLRQAIDFAKLKADQVWDSTEDDEVVVTVVIEECERNDPGS